mgnify:CR=1 FL=1
MKQIVVTVIITVTVILLALGSFQDGGTVDQMFDDLLDDSVQEAPTIDF